MFPDIKIEQILPHNNLVYNILIYEQWNKNIVRYSVTTILYFTNYQVQKCKQSVVCIMKTFELGRSISIAGKSIPI